MSGSVLNSVMWVGLGRRLGEFLVALDVDLGELEGEFQPQKNGQAGGERADELLMPLADAAQFAGGEKAGMAEIVAAHAWPGRRSRTPRAVSTNISPAVGAGASMRLIGCRTR